MTKNLPLAIGNIFIPFGDLPRGIYNPDYIVVGILADPEESLTLIFLTDSRTGMLRALLPVADVKPSYTKYLEFNPQDTSKRSWLAKLAVMCEQWKEADRQFDVRLMWLEAGTSPDAVDQRLNQTQFRTQIPRVPVHSILGFVPYGPLVLSKWQKKKRIFRDYVHDDHKAWLWWDRHGQRLAERLPASRRYSAL
jgi:hypothetical protein